MRAKPMAVRSLELDDALPEAHNALAVIKCRYELDWEGAGQEFRRALTLDPDKRHTRAMVCSVPDRHRATRKSSG
jgi:hypothetical protein